MSEKPRVTVVVPVYNEEKSISGVLNRIREEDRGYEILVVDDGSTDATAVICSEAGIRTVRHPYRKGNGAAVKSGIINSDADIVVVVDGDGQYDVSDIPAFIEAMAESDLVVGARNSQSKETVIRRAGNKALSAISTYLSGKRIFDLTSGFRAFKREKMLEFINLLPDGFSLPATSTMAFINSGYNVKFIPVEMAKREHGTRSKLNPLREGFRFLMIILRITTLFNPLKIFLPLAFILWALAAADAAVGILISSVMPGTAIILFISGVIIFFFGFLAEQMTYMRREVQNIRRIFICRNKQEG